MDQHLLLEAIWRKVAAHIQQKVGQLLTHFDKCCAEAAAAVAAVTEPTTTTGSPLVEGSRTTTIG